MTYKIYSFNGPDEHCLFDDPEKPYNEEDIDSSEEITQKIHIGPDDEIEDELGDEDDDIERGED